MKPQPRYQPGDKIGGRYQVQPRSARQSYYRDRYRKRARWRRRIRSYISGWVNAGSSPSLWPWRR